MIVKIRKIDISKYTTVERQDADIRSKVEELEALNQSMRDRDKLKDAIAHLSDQLIALTTRLDSIQKTTAIEGFAFNGNSVVFFFPRY